MKLGSVRFPKSPTQRFRVVTATLIALHFALLLFEESGVGIVADVIRLTGRRSDGAAAAAQPALYLVVALLGVGLSSCLACGYVQVTCAALLFLISVWFQSALSTSGVDGFFVCVTTFWLVWLCIPSSRESRQVPEEAPCRLTVRSLLMCVWVCYLAPDVWSGSGELSGWRGLLALAPPLYVLNSPLATWTATVLQLGAHGWLCLTANAPITQGLMAATVLLFRLEAGSSVGRGVQRLRTGGIVTLTVAGLYASLLVLPAMGLRDSAQRARVALAILGLSPTLRGPRHHFAVLDALGSSPVPLRGAWFDRSWQTRLDLCMAAIESGEASRSMDAVDRVAAHAVSSFCDHASPGPERQLVATDLQTNKSRTLARFYCVSGKPAAVRLRPTSESGVAKHSPYAL